MPTANTRKSSLFGLSATKSTPTSKRRSTSPKSAPKTHLSAEDAEIDQLEQEVIRLRNVVAARQQQLPAADTWRTPQKHGKPQRSIPTVARAQQNRERSVIFIELAFGALVLAAAVNWLWQRFAQ